MTKAVFFNSSQDAQKVAEQFYGTHYIDESAIVFPPSERFDIRAINLAAGLAGVEFDKKAKGWDLVSDYTHCLLPINKAEWAKRECLSIDDRAVYVRDLASANCGYLHGMWISCDQSEEEILADVEYMMSWSPVRDTEHCEEWRIDDHKGWGDVDIHEWESFENLAGMASAIAEYGRPYEAFLSFWDEHNAEKFEEMYMGEYQWLEDYARERYEGHAIYELLANSKSEIDKELFRHLDFESMVQAWILTGEIKVVQGETDYSDIKDIKECHYIFSQR